MYLRFFINQLIHFYIKEASNLQIPQCLPLITLFTVLLIFIFFQHIIDCASLCNHHSKSDDCNALKYFDANKTCMLANLDVLAEASTLEDRSLVMVEEGLEKSLDLVCKGGDSCCFGGKCKEGDGDCDNDFDCQGTLVCG